MHNVIVSKVHRRAGMAVKDRAVVLQCNGIVSSALHTRVALGRRRRRGPQHWQRPFGQVMTCERAHSVCA